MKLPLMTTFLPQITISLVLGVVSILIFSNMHHNAVDESMRNSLRGSMIYSESRIGGPFEVAKSDAGRLIESARLHNAFVFRGNDNRIHPALTGNTTADAVALQGLLEHFQDMAIAMNFSKGVYSYISQMFRNGRKVDTSLTSTNPLDFDWHWSGASTRQYYHPLNTTTQALFNNNRQDHYPRYTSDDLYFASSRGYSITGVWWTPANSSTGYFGDIYTWVQRGTGKFEILMPVVMPMSYDPATGYITSLMEIDVDCNSWMTAFLEDLDIPGTELTIINPKSSQVMSSSFPALAPGYNVKNASNARQSVLWGLYDTPETRLSSAMKRVEALGFGLGSLPYETKILEDPKEKDIVTVRPVRQAGANLLMVAVTERDHYFGEGERTQRDAIIICAILLVAALVVAVVTAILLSRPLSDLGNRMALTASLQDDDTELQPSMVSEISEMQASYSAMKAELSRVKSFLPQSVLAGNMGDEDDDDEGDVADSTENGRRSSRGSSCNSTIVSSRHSTTNESSCKSGAAFVGAALNLAANAVSKRVTVAMFNLKGFNQRVRSGDNNSILRLQSEFLELVLTKARQQRGVLDTFNGDHITVTWNAVTNIASASLRAVNVAYEICRVATQNPRMPSVSVGISQGQALVGNSGTSDAKRFNVMGVVYSAAAKLERMASAQLNDQNRRVILMSQSMLMEVEHEYFVKCIDVARFANGGAPSVIATLLGPKETNTDEWMYELREGEAADNNRLINAAFHQLAKGDTAGFEEALACVPEADRQVLLEAKEKTETTKC